MNKQELSVIVAANAGITNLSAERAVEATLLAIQNAIARGEQVRLVGFGNFSVSRVKPRTMRNPKTGQKVEVSARLKPVFKPGKSLKQAADQMKVVA